MSSTGGRKPEYLELGVPSAACGYCRFSQAIGGQWSAEDGRLVFRAGPDPLPGRGPGLESCCEGRECGEFAGIRQDWPRDAVLSDEDVAALRAAARKAQEDEMRA